MARWRTDKKGQGLHPAEQRNSPQLLAPNMAPKHLVFGPGTAPYQKYRPSFMAIVKAIMDYSRGLHNNLFSLHMREVMGSSPFIPTTNMSSPRHKKMSRAWYYFRNSPPSCLKRAAALLFYLAADLKRCRCLRRLRFSW
jgi:hypothetical protein